LNIVTNSVKFTAEGGKVNLIVDKIQKEKDEKKKSQL